MLWFKKNLYKVVWAFDSESLFTYTEYVEAPNEAKAWRKIAKQHYAIDCRKIEMIGRRLDDDR